MPNNEHIQCFVMGGYNTAVQTVTGQWYAFGRNDYGQLGLSRGWPCVRGDTFFFLLFCVFQFFRTFPEASLINFTPESRSKYLFFLLVAHQSSQHANLAWCTTVLGLTPNRGWG